MSCAAIRSSTEDLERMTSGQPGKGGADHGRRILLVDDQEIIRKGVRSFLGRNAEWEVCGEATNGREAAEAACRIHPDVIIMDVTMPEMDGIAATREIKKSFPGVRILMLSMHNSTQLVDSAFSAGANGYMLKEELGSQLFSALETISLGVRYLSPGLLK
jgi:DNA-binding NarL/FixJ family response regulator